MDHDQLKNDFKKSGIERLPDNADLKQYAGIFLEELHNREEESLISETVMKSSSTTIRTIFGIHRQSEMAAKMAKLPLLRDTVTTILQQPNYLLQSQINFKPTGVGSGFPAHRDVHYFYNRDGIQNADLTMGVMINLVDTVSSMGPVIMLKGSHHTYTSLPVSFSYTGGKPSLLRSSKSAQDPGRLSPEEIAAHDDYERVELVGKAGSTFIFDSRNVHWSEDNLQNNPRPVLIFWFNVLSNKPKIQKSPWFLSETETIY